MKVGKMPTIRYIVFFATLLSIMVLLAVDLATQDTSNADIRKRLTLGAVTQIVPSSYVFDSSRLDTISGQTILNHTVLLTVLTNDRDWRLPIWLDVDTKMPEAVGITCRLLDSGKAVIREGAIVSGYAELLGTGEVGSFDFFLNVEGIWDGQVPDSLQKVVLVFTGRRLP